MWEIDCKGNYRSHELEFPLEYNSFEAAESAFIHTVMEEMQTNYMFNTQVNSLDIDKQAIRLKELANNVRRFKSGEIKKARYDFRTCTIILREKAL